VHHIALALPQVGKGDLGVSTDSPEVIVTGIDGDPTKPWPERRSRSEPPNSHIHLQKDVLGQIFYILLTSEKAADDGKHMPVIQRKQGLEGLPIAFLRLSDEAGFSL
jgi:hypothetical protein